MAYLTRNRSITAYYLCLFLVLMQIFGCSKDDNSPVVNPDPIDDRIKELFYLDTTQIAPNDTLSKIVFGYDVSGRAISISTNSYSPISGLYTYNGGIVYAYSGSDTLPSKATRTLFSGIGNVTTAINRHFFDYDSEGRLIKDSVQRIIINPTSGYDSSVYTDRFSYASNQLIHKRNDYYPTVNASTPITYVSEKDSRGNIVKQGLANPWYFYEYDTKYNPLKRACPMNYPFIRSSEFFWINVTSHIEQNNNFLKVFNRTYDASGNMLTSNLSKEIFFIYNANGLPASSRYKTYPASIQDKYKFVYKY